MQQLQNHLLDTVYIQGLQNIDKASTREVHLSIETANKTIETQSEWIIDTEGTNLRQVLALPEVDNTRTISNDIIEIYNIFGVEMANAVLAQEIRHVLSFDGTYVNERHIQLLVDTMTFRGFLCPVSRHGMAKSALGPLMRSSFEETVDVLLDAAVYSEKDQAKGVTENIMLGNLAPIGTGAIQLDCSHAACRAAPEEPRGRGTARVASEPAAQPTRFIGRRATKRPRSDENTEKGCSTEYSEKKTCARSPPRRAHAVRAVGNGPDASIWAYRPSSPNMLPSRCCGYAYAPSSPRIITMG